MKESNDVPPVPRPLDRDGVADELEPGLLVVDAIYDALERGDPDAALKLVQHTLAGADGDDPVIHFLGGVALLELDRAAQAADALQRATEQDPDDVEFRATLALALFRCCRFEQATAQIRLAAEGDPNRADNAFVEALLLEREGEFAPAEERFRRAHELDAERFPLPLRLSAAAFEDQVARAIDRLPERFRRHLDQVAVTVEELPSTEVLLDEGETLAPENLLGLFVGVPLAERDGFDGPAQLPPRILIFKRNLERLALDHDELAEEIAVTVYHELGHYLGLDEDELERIDLG